MRVLPYLCTYMQQIHEEVHGFCPVSAKYGILPNPPWYCNELFKQMPAWEEESEWKVWERCLKGKLQSYWGVAAFLEALSENAGIPVDHTIKVTVEIPGVCSPIHR